ncbi:MAG: LCP family protein [Spirochaetales bacterium]|nr:LCP family protein [Spirochaetales bacterium]
MKGRNRKRAIDKGVVVLALIILVIGASALLLALQLRSDKITEDIRENRLISILIMVHDAGTLLFSELFLYHPTTGNGALLDIPGEWGDVIEPLKRVDRIDTLFDQSDPEDFRAKVSRLIALDISQTMQFDLGGMEAAIDILDGIDLFIADPVEIVEEGRLVLVPSGSVTLDGRKATTYVSFTDENESSLESRTRHQKAVQSLLKKIGEKKEYLAREDVFREFYDRFDTSMGKRAFASLLESLHGLDVDHLILKPVHGDEVAVDDQVLLFPHSNGKLIQESVRQLVEALANTEVLSEEELTVILEVLNGTTKQGLAARTRQLFINFGYEVELYGNADRFDYEKTLVISRTNDMLAAQRVASLIGCTNIEQQPYLVSDPEAGMSLAAVDVTIILGQDFDGRYCKE